MIISGMINFLLSQDTETANQLFQHQPKILQIELLPMHFNLYFLVKNNKIAVSKTPPEIVDTVMRGTPADFMASMCSNKVTVEVSGDMDFAQTLQQVFQKLDIDVEELLSKITGDSIAYGIGSIFRQLKKTGKETSTRFGQNMKEYIEEEQRFIVSKAETEDYCNAVDKIRDDVERLSQRIEMINE